MLLGRDVLVTEEDHLVLEECAPQRRQRRIVQRAREVDAGDFGADRRAEWPQSETVVGRRFTVRVHGLQRSRSRVEFRHRPRPLTSCAWKSTPEDCSGGRTSYPDCARRSGSGRWAFLRFQKCMKMSFTP